MKKLILFAASLILAGITQTSSAQMMLRKAAVDNGGAIAFNGTTAGAFVVGQTAAGTAHNSTTVGHFGFLAVPTVVNAGVTSGVGAINSVAISPNPASADASIEITLASPQNLDLFLYDATGRLIATLFSGHKEAGTFIQHVDTRTLASGAYFIAARIPGALVQTKLNVVK